MKKTWISAALVAASGRRAGRLEAEKPMFRSFRWLVIALCAITPAIPFAQPYPSKPVRVIVAFAPGGTADFVARLTAQKLTESTGKPFVVENRSGAGGRIGYDAGVKSPGDGYTLVLLETSYSMAPGLYGKSDWDLVPVTRVAYTPLVIVVGPNVKATTLRELIAAAKANPGKLNYGSGGVGSATHVSTELFKELAGVDLTHVPFKGSGDAMIAVLSGTMEVTITTVQGAMSHVTSGKVKALAVTLSRRSAALPDVPSITEVGLPKFEVVNWHGIGAPKGTPKELVSYLHQEVVKMLAPADMKDKLAAQGVEPSGNTPEEFEKLVRDETKRWGDVIRSIGVKLE